MSTIELKQSIIKIIQGSDDEILIRDIARMINLEFNDKEIYNLTDAEKKAVQQGLDDIKNGNTVSGEEADKDIDRWLRK